MDHVVRRRAFARRAGEICACVLTLAAAACAKDARVAATEEAAPAATTEGGQGTRAKGEEGSMGGFTTSDTPAPTSITA